MTLKRSKEGPRRGLKRAGRWTSGQVVVSGIWTRPGLADGGRLVIHGDNAESVKDLRIGTGRDAGCMHRADSKFHGFS